MARGPGRRDQDWLSGFMPTKARDLQEALQVVSKFRWSRYVNAKVWH
jgi:hypothetical protein